MSSHTPELSYKIVTGAVWAAAQGLDVVPLMPIDVSDGYVHLSTADQLAETLSLHFKGQSGLTVLAIRLADLADKVKWEPSRGGQVFPHVYGDIPKSAIVWQKSVSVAENGSSDLPDPLT